VLLTAGCPSSIYDTNSLSLATISAIADDDELTASEKRTQLEALELEPLIINALLIEERLANQFGGDIDSVTDKVVGGRYTELTPDEVQIFSDAANTVKSSLSSSLTDTEAQALVDFFNANNLNTATDVEVYIDDATNEIPANVPDNVLRELFVDFDPADLPTTFEEPEPDADSGTEPDALSPGGGGSITFPP
jgi:hypothetical protein